jgi:hypothetical protein
VWEESADMDAIDRSIECELRTRCDFNAEAMRALVSVTSFVSFHFTIGLLIIYCSSKEAGGVPSSRRRKV